jgi:hypothetical protein
LPPSIERLWLDELRRAHAIMNIDGGDDDTQKGLDSVAEEAGEADSLLAG